VKITEKRTLIWDRY